MGVFLNCGRGVARRVVSRSVAAARSWSCMVLSIVRLYKAWRYLVVNQSKPTKRYLSYTYWVTCWSDLTPAAWLPAGVQGSRTHACRRRRCLVRRLGCNRLLARTFHKQVWVKSEESFNWFLTHHNIYKNWIFSGSPLHRWKEVSPMRSPVHRSSASAWRTGSRGVWWSLGYGGVSFLLCRFGPSSGPFAPSRQLSAVASRHPSCFAAVASSRWLADGQGSS